MVTTINEQDRKYLFRHMEVFPDYIQDYFKSKLHSLSPSTLRGYAIDIEDFLNWLIYDEVVTVSEIKDISLSSLEELKTNQIENDFIKYLNLRDYQGGRKMKGKKLNGKTLTRKLSALRALFYWLTYIAKDENLEPLLKENVMEEIVIEREMFNPELIAKKIRHHILAGEEFGDYRNFVLNGYATIPNLKKLAIRKHKENRERDTAIISLMLETGIRVVEVANLNMDDINLNDCTLKVSRKSGKSIVIELTEQAVVDLKRYVSVREEQYEPPVEQKALFLTNQQAPGQKMTKRAIQNMVEKYSEAYGMKMLTAQKLRYSFAARHYAEHEDLDKLQEIMGHSDVNSTKVFACLLDETKQAHLE